MRILYTLLFISFIVKGQSIDVDKYFVEKGEVYFSFEINDSRELNEISSIVSIDHGSTIGQVHAYANKKEFIEFLKKDIPFNIETSPGELFKDLNMKSELDTKSDTWDYYPTYELYVEMMYGFEEQYPNICSVSSLGNSTDGRELIVAKISDSLNVEEGEPRLLYTSSMHGDEITGFVLSLRLIDYLLSNYEVDSRITEIVNNVEIWINPLANPDGAYTNNNSTVFGASRYNANWVDLNRNYPDPEDGAHPDGNFYQSETVAFMDFADSCEFDISSNFHGGAEVVNYPWDTWSNVTADYDWWTHVMHEYADTAQAHSELGYFSSFEDGVTNGFDWYEVNGGRQDYMNYDKMCREFTIEFSNSKTPPGAQLPYYWEANYRSLLRYIEQSRFGLHGIITDSLSGEPLKATVFIEGHDVDNSHVNSHLPIGDYHRYLSTGNYDISYSAEGYETKIITDVPLLNNETTILDVQLAPINVGVENVLFSKVKVFPIPASTHIYIEGVTSGNKDIIIQDSSGLTVYKDLGNSESVIKIQTSQLGAGVYTISVLAKEFEYTKSIVIQ
jgi:hypothetical protein